jgi:enoyl-CoA hydratase/carnithine racemase
LLRGAELSNVRRSAGGGFSKPEAGRKQGETAVSVRYERKGRLAVITLDRPAALNALTLEMIGEVESLARRAEADPAVFAICITGEGRGFCAGLDMSALADHAAGKAPPASAEALARPERRMMFSALPTIAKPVIAAVNGVAAGGGFILAMMSDLRFMAEGANLITVFSRRGLVAEHGAAFMLTRQVGLSRALDLLWSSRRIGAAEALRIGLADRVVASETLLAAVETYVEEMADTVAPRSVAAMKRQAYAYLEMSFAEAAADTAALIDASLAHPDAAEGATSFVERRPPRFAPLD